MQAEVLQSAPKPETAARPWAKLVVFAIIAGVALGLTLGLGIPAIQTALAQPKITLYGVTYATSGGCGFFEPGRFAYEVTFSLINSGNANGFASVNFHVGTNDRGSIVYYVPQGATVPGTNVIYGDWGCPIESPSAVLASLWKA